MPIPTDSLEKYESAATKEDVYKTLRQWIIEGILEPGEKILDLDIAQFFHVSRTPIREVFQQLENQNLVTIMPGKGTVITKLETDHIEKWYHPMMVLQQLGTKLAIQNIRPEGLEKLKEIEAKFEMAVGSQSILDIFELDREFHECIMRIADNEYIVKFCDTLMIHIQRLEYTYFKVCKDLDRSVYEHRRLIRAFEMRDEISAELEMKNNWNMTMIHLNVWKESNM